MRCFILLLTCVFFINGNVSAVHAQEEEPTEQSSADKKKAIKAYMAAEKKWMAKQVGYGKKICKILSKVKSAKDADNAAKKIDAVHLTSSGEPKSPRPKMPEGVTSEDLPLKDVKVNEETSFRTHLPKKLLSNYSEIMNEIEYTMADMEESSPKLETSVQKYMKHSAPFLE